MINTEKSLMYRVGAGKALGLMIGLAGFFVLPLLVHDTSLLLRSGVLLWYPTMGAIVGIFGAFAYHPVFNFPMPWWLRGALIGGWMNFVLTLFAYDQIATLSMAVFGEYSLFTSPFLMVIEGALMGLSIDYLVTRWFGEGWVDKSTS